MEAADDALVRAIFRDGDEARSRRTWRDTPPGHGSALANHPVMHLRLGRRELLGAFAGGVAGAMMGDPLREARAAGPKEATASLEPPELKIPPRDPEAPGATAIFDDLEDEPLPAVQERLVSEIVAGNLPSFLRRPRPVQIDETTTVWAVSDYLAVGSDDDHLWVPLAAPAAQRIANALGALLPTPQIVDAIHAEAEVRLPAMGLNQPVALGCLRQARTHARMIDEVMKKKKVARKSLLAGHKKDVVITPALAWAPGRVAIYGFHNAGRPIQPLSTLHIVTYVDYSHGVRLLADVIDRKGERRRLSEVLGQREASKTVSPPGPIDLPAYPASWEEAVAEQKRAWAQGT
jgi:hypothetical protein